MATTPATVTGCESLKVSRAEAVKALDSIIDEGHDLKVQPVRSEPDVARARSRLAAWSGAAESALARIVASPGTAQVFRMVAVGMPSTSPYPGGTGPDYESTRIARGVARRLDELSLIRSWLDQCH